MFTGFYITKNTMHFMKQLIPIFILLTVFIIKTEAQNNLSDTSYFTKWDTCAKQDLRFGRVSIRENNIFKITDYYPDWKIKMTGYFKTLEPEIKEGSFKYYSREGSLVKEGNFLNNKATGLWKEYKNGYLWLEEEYTNGRRNGFLKTYYDGKILKRQELYKDSNFIEGKCFTRLGKDTSFCAFIVLPKFHEGEKDIYKYLWQNLRYPEKCIRKNIQGTIRVRFEVYADGSVQNVMIAKSVHPLLDQEAMRVIASMPNWSPEILEGEIVSCFFQVPITFRIE